MTKTEYANGEINFSVPPVPSLNHVYRNVRVNLRITTKEGKAWMSMVRGLALVAKANHEWQIPKEKKIVMELSFFWPDRRRRDTDNCIKLLSDTLQGVLYDDDRWVLPRVLDWHIDKEDPRVEVKLWVLE